MNPERWFVLGVRIPDDEVAPELLAEGLLRAGGRAVEEDGEWFRTYLPAPDEPETFLREAREKLERVTGISPLEVAGEWKPHREWEEVWKEGLRPRAISDRLVVAPPWESPGLEPGQIAVIIDPGMAFGTAEHATTRGCLRLLDEVVGPGDVVLDVGAGSAILSIAAVRFGASRAVAVEMDEHACAAARENVAANGVDEDVEVVHAQASPEILESLEGIDPLHGLAANIESGVLLPLLPSFRWLLEDDGWLILSGIRTGEEDEMAEAAEEFGFRLESRDREDGWSALLFTAVEGPSRNPSGPGG